VALFSAAGAGQLAKHFSTFAGTLLVFGTLHVSTCSRLASGSRCACSGRNSGGMSRATPNSWQMGGRMGGVAVCRWPTAWGPAQSK